MKKLDIIIFGLSITSSWGNGHATTFRSLVKALDARGHRITFFEKDVPWYAAHRDLPDPPFCKTILYQSPKEIDARDSLIANADLVILGSYVADAELLTKKVTALSPACFAFYDIDTPVTLAKLEKGDFEYLTPTMIPTFDIYFSFTGGPILKKLEREYGAQKALPLYCSVDPQLYFPEAPIAPASIESAMTNKPSEYLLGYLGTYSDDRQPTLNELLIEPAKKLLEEKFCIAGAKYPETFQWPDNVKVIEHIPPHSHRHFYNSQCFALNVTRRDMINAGYSPSVRLFEAGACATPIISDSWEGLDSFFAPGEEILIARNRNEVLDYLRMPEAERRALGLSMREKVLGAHTSAHRAREIELHWQEVTARSIVVNP